MYLSGNMAFGANPPGGIAVTLAPCPNVTEVTEDGGAANYACDAKARIDWPWRRI